MFPMVQRACKKALTKANIVHCFEYIGIYPFNQHKILPQNQLSRGTPSIPWRPGLRSASTTASNRKQNSALDFLALRLQDPTSDTEKLCIELLSIAKSFIARATIAEDVVRKMEAAQKRHKREGSRRILSRAGEIGRKEVERARKRLLAEQARQRVQQSTKIKKTATPKRAKAHTRPQHTQNSDTIWADDTEVENAIEELMAVEANSDES